MDDLAVSLIGQVEEQEDPTMCLQFYTEVNASYVRLKEKQESIGVKACFLYFIDVNNIKQRW